MQANFVIGTGRCGSTLLSTLLTENRQALVLSEFFGGLDMINRFSPAPMSGEDLATMLTRDMELAHFWKTRSLLCEPVDGNTVYAQIDGEPLARLPVEFRIVPRALKLLVPSPALPTP